MRALLLPFLALAAGCGGRKEADLLASLAGTWSGTVSTDTVAIPAVAEFTWDDEQALLVGEVTLQDPPPEVPHTYAVRRWDVIRGYAWLDLTDVLDGTRALHLDEGEVDGTFSGTAVVRYDCGQASPCGYTGTFELAPAPLPTDTAPPVTTPRDTSAP